MNKILIGGLLMIVACSSDPVNMDKVLFERSGQYITNDDFHSFFYFNRKVYNGPAYSLHKNGKKKEEGDLKNGFRTGVWHTWYDDEKKRYTGGYNRGKEHGKWIAYYYTNGKTKYEGSYKDGLQEGKWIYFDETGNKELEEIYFSCTEECEKSHFKRPCPKEGKVKESKEL